MRAAGAGGRANAAAGAPGAHPPAAAAAAVLAAAAAPPPCSLLVPPPPAFCLVFICVLEGGEHFCCGDAAERRRRSASDAFYPAVAFLFDAQSPSAGTFFFCCVTALGACLSAHTRCSPALVCCACKTTHTFHSPLACRFLPQVKHQNQLARHYRSKCIIVPHRPTGHKQRGNAKQTEMKRENRRRLSCQRVLVAARHAAARPPVLTTTRICRLCIQQHTSQVVQLKQAPVSSRRPRFR